MRIGLIHEDSRLLAGGIRQLELRDGSGPRPGGRAPCAAYPWPGCTREKRAAGR